MKYKCNAFHAYEQKKECNDGKSPTMTEQMDEGRLKRKRY